jgi:hypothetical protein
MFGKCPPQIEFLFIKFLLPSFQKFSFAGVVGGVVRYIG